MLNKRDFGNSPGFEKFSSNKRGTTKARRRRPPKKEVVGHVSREIVQFVRRRMDGVVYASNFKNAVDLLWRKLRRNGHTKDVISAAFSLLVEGKIFRRDELGNYGLVAAA